MAKHFQTQIISADSRQCFKELKIGVARPSEEELTMVPHHFIASHSIHETINAGVFEKYALEKAEQLFKQNEVVIMVGGTGLYIKAFCEGIDEMPEVPDSIRNEIISSYNEFGLNWLQEQVKQADPDFYTRGRNSKPTKDDAGS